MSPGGQDQGCLHPCWVPSTVWHRTEHRRSVSFLELPHQTAGGGGRQRRSRYRKPHQRKRVAFKGGENACTIGHGGPNSAQNRTGLGSGAQS